MLNVNPTIKIEADPKLLTLLERLAEAFEHYHAAAQPAEAPVAVPVAAPDDVKPNDPEPAQEAAQEAAQPEEPAPQEPAPTPEAVQPTVTIDQIRKQVVTLSAMGAEVKAKVRETINAYGRNVSAIPVEKYAEVMDRLEALKGA